MPRHSLTHFVLRGLFAGALVVYAGSALANAAQPTEASRAAQARFLGKRPYKAGTPKALPNSYTIARNTYLSPQEYSDLAGGVTELLKRYPPDKYYFIGLGRDPAPVIAFLQNLGEKELAANLPGTSNIGWAGRAQPGDIARHIEAAIPQHILHGDRQLVVLDVTGTGKTPSIFGPHLDAYLASKGIQKTCVKLAFSWVDVRQNAQYGRGVTDWIDTRAWSDFAKYYTGKYEGNWAPSNPNGTGIAEHQRHEMGPGIEPPTATSPNYAAFRAALMERMEQDHALDQFLSTHVASAFKPETPEEAAQRVAAEKQAAAEREAAERAAAAAAIKLERSKRAESLRGARKVPSVLVANLTQLVDGMGERTEGHDKGPYLSPNALLLDKWLVGAIAQNASASQLVPRFANEANRLVARYFDEVERARKERKIRNRDYRRLMGHGMSAATMDEAMLASLVERFGESKHFRREIVEESKYYQTSHTRKARPETANMATAYNQLVSRLPASVQQDIQRHAEASAEEAEGE